MDFPELQRVSDEVPGTYFNYLVAVFKESFTYDLLKSVFLIDLSEILGEHVIIELALLHDRVYYYVFSNIFLYHFNSKRSL